MNVFFFQSRTNVPFLCASFPYAAGFVLSYVCMYEFYVCAFIRMLVCVRIYI